MTDEQTGTADTRATRKSKFAFTMHSAQQEKPMGYTTEFTGAVKLSRKLTMAEAKTLLEIADDNAKETTGIDAYFQWVPADTLEHIVWDGNEKFYKYVEQLQWLCDWLDQRGISANGNLYWQGEETGDNGTLVIADNAVTRRPNEKPSSGSPTPLTLDGLGRIALGQVAGGHHD